MTLDNSSATELDRTITWQFDNATHLVGIIEALKDFYQQSTHNFWDSFVPNAENINTANDYGLALWGKILGYDWPSYSSSGVKISSTLYRKILKARFVLLNSRGTFQDYLTYLNSIFGNGGVSIVDNNNMSVTLTMSPLLESSEEEKLFDQQDENLFLMPAGVQFKSNPDGLMFMLADVSETRTKEQVIDDYPSAGGLDESTFTWS